MLRVEQIPTGPLMTNCYLLWDEGEGGVGNGNGASRGDGKANGEGNPSGGTKPGVIIDPGDDVEKILARVRSLGINVEQILATHCHFDHIGAVAPLKREIDAPFVIHKDDLSFLHECESSARRWGFRIEQPADPDGYVDEGDTIMVGDNQLKVVHTPGHSPGGVSYLHGSMAFVGDCLFQGSIGRTDFREGSFEILERSIQTKLYTLPEETKVYTGHGPPTTIGQEKKSNPFVRPLK